MQLEYRGEEAPYTEILFSPTVRHADGRVEFSVVEVREVSTDPDSNKASQAMSVGSNDSSANPATERGQ